MDITYYSNIVSSFLKTQPVLKAYLFGSSARGQETINSDIDILVEFEKNVDLFQFAAIKIKLESLLNKKVDLVSSQGISPRIKPHIDADKILIYAK